jgi:hypothetical protein
MLFGAAVAASVVMRKNPAKNPILLRRGLILKFIKFI